MSGTEDVAPLRLAMSQDQKIHLGYTVFLYSPYDERCHYLTGPGAGHRWFWTCEEATAVEEKLLEEHGAIARWNGPFGVCLFPGSRV